MAMSADLGKPLEDYVNDLVEGGRYRSRSEVLREGVRLVQEREVKLAKFHQEIQQGLEQADRGELFELDDVFEDVLDKSPT